MYNIKQVLAESGHFSPKELMIARRKFIERFIFFLIVLLLILAGLAINVYSQERGGGYAESYLLRDVGARPRAMGGAYTAIANEPLAIFYNPAGLGFFSNKPILNSSISTLGWGRINSTIAWAQSVYQNLGVGFGINSFVSEPFTATDSRGNTLGTYQDWQYSMTASISYMIENFSVGTSLKYLKNNLTGSKTYAEGFTFDIGTKFNVLNLFSVGVVVQNISGMMFWNNLARDAEAIPYVIRTGIAMEYGLNEEVYTTRSTVSGELEDVYIPATKYVLFALDAVLVQHQSTPTIVFGAEAVADEMIAFRGGIALYGEDMGIPQFFPMTHWGGGVSIRPNAGLLDLPFVVFLDYTISGEHISSSGISHCVSLQFEF